MGKKGRKSAVTTKDVKITLVVNYQAVIFSYQVTSAGLTIYFAVFRIRFFSPRSGLDFFYLSPDPDRTKIRIRSGKIRIRENNAQNWSKSRKNVIFHIQHS